MGRRQIERKEGTNKVKSISQWGGIKRAKVNETENEKKTAEKRKKN